MRVLIVTSEFHPRIGGIARYVTDMAQALCAANGEAIEVGLIAGEGQHAAPDARYSILDTLNLVAPADSEAFALASARLISVARTFRPDVIHLANAGLAVFAKALAPIAPVFATVHGKDLTRPWQQAPGADVPAAIRQGLASCEQVFCVSRFTRDLLLDRCPEARGLVLTPGLTSRTRLATFASPRESRAAPGDTSRRAHIVTIGQVIRRKGHRRLLTVLERMREPVSWTVIGAGPGLGVLRERVEASPLKRHIRLAKELDDAAMWSELARADLFALTPVTLEDDAGLDVEGFGLVFIEAAALDVPVVGSLYGGCGDAVRNGETGLLIDPLDPKRAAVELDALVVDPERLTRMGEAGRHFALEGHRWSDRAQDLIEAYRKARTLRPSPVGTSPSRPKMAPGGRKHSSPGGSVCVLVPVGPNCRPSFVRDSLESAVTWLEAGTRIVVLDNSGAEVGARAAQEIASTEVLTFPEPSGLRGGLYVILARGLAYVREHHDPEIVVRMDTDALVTGPDLVETARARFDADPTLASLGACRIAATGGARDFSTSAAALERAVGRGDAIGALLGGAIALARLHGYEPGEHILGGGCLYHRRALDALDAMGLLDEDGFGALGVSEDVLFGLFLRAAGLTLGEFARPGEPMGCKWRGLPADPPTLQAQGRSLIHSVRNAGPDWDEARIRAWFRAERDRRVWTDLSRRAG